VGQRVHNATEPWRIIFLRRNGTELLVLEKEGEFVLPQVDVPNGARIALELNARLKSAWNLDGFSLCPVRPNPPSSRSAIRYHAVESVQQESDGPASAHWLPVFAPTEVQFADVADLMAIREWRQGVVLFESSGNPTPFGNPGCLARVRDWVQQSLDPWGLKVTGQFLQFNAGASCSLIRFETDGGAVWFKAVGEPNEREFPLIVALSDRFPLYTPQLLATQPVWNAWLAQEVPGARLSQCRDDSAWINSARDLAILQINSLDAVDHILTLGARDTRAPALLALAEPFFARLRELMKLQSRSVPPRLSPSELDQLQQDTTDALADISQEQLPDALGHLDLNPENIIALPERTVFLDWAEASVGHPLFSLACLLEHCRNSFKDTRGCASQLISAYMDVWRIRSGDLDRILCLALFLAVFAHAVSTDSWRDAEQLEDCRIAGYYRSLGRRMKSYADGLHSGSSIFREMFT
jgi:hypothetical protein